VALTALPSVVERSKSGALGDSSTRMALGAHSLRAYGSSKREKGAGVGEARGGGGGS
jgi:hypothetical protein